MYTMYAQLQLGRIYYELGDLDTKHKTCSTSPLESYFNKIMERQLIAEG